MRKEWTEKYFKVLGITKEANIMLDDNFKKSLLLIIGNLNRQCLVNMCKCVYTQAQYPKRLYFLHRGAFTFSLRLKNAQFKNCGLLSALLHKLITNFWFFTAAEPRCNTFICELTRWANNWLLHVILYLGQQKIIPCKITISTYLKPRSDLNNWLFKTQQGRLFCFTCVKCCKLENS